MKLIPNSLKIAPFLVLVATATAADPAWWAERGVTTADPSSNYSPATLGQAKWMAHQAIKTLQSILPDVAAQIDGDLTGGSNPILQNGWTVPANPDENLAVLTIGQLKALAHPFHARLAAAVGNEWMNAHLLSHGLPAGAGDPGVLHADYLAADGVYYPWTLVQSPENHAMANLGQLKLCFDLPLTEDQESPPDGLPDLWEHAVVHANPPGGTWTDIGLIHVANAAQAAAETGIDLPSIDRLVDKSGWETPDWLTLTGNGTKGQAIPKTQTFMIKKGKSRMLVVGMASEEYPVWTSDQSEFNDLLEWEITSKIGPKGPDINVATGSLDVNTLHYEWDLANYEGITLQGFSPAHMEKIAAIHAPGEADVTVTVTLTVTNIGDADFPSTFMVGLVPVEVVDNRFATGVDRISKTAASTDIGYQEDFWIMAPAGSPPAGGDCENDTKLFIPLDDSVDLLIHADKATADPNTIDLITENDAATADTDETLNKVTWHGKSNESGENAIQWAFGPNEPEQDLLPIKVMTMKNRKVKVVVHLVDLTASDGSRRALDPDLIPTDDSVTNHLNDIFAKQINAWFDVEIVKDKDPQNQQEVNFLADQRTDGDDSFNVASLSSFSIDQQQVLNQTGPVGDSDIRVFMISTIGIEGGYGLANRDSATCWVAGLKSSLKYESTEDVLSTIGHEIGHVLVGEGHPNDAGTGNPADLTGTTHRVRLMCSGAIRDRRNGKLLVKAEWDAAETWLSNRPNGDR